MKEWLQPRDKKLLAETAKWLLVLTGTYAIATLSLTKNQRESIRDERDGGKCQGGKAGVPHKCGGRLEVHHIQSGMYLRELGIDADANPYNLITICSNLHDMIHPPRINARRTYHEKKAAGRNSFKEMSDEMKQQISNKQLNWNPEFDRKLLARAAKLQQEWMKRNGGYPLTREQQSKYGRDRI